MDAYKINRVYKVCVTLKYQHAKSTTRMRHKCRQKKTQTPWIPKLNCFHFNESSNTTYKPLDYLGHYLLLMLPRTECFCMLMQIEAYVILIRPSITYLSSHMCINFCSPYRLNNIGFNINGTRSYCHIHVWSYFLRASRAIIPFQTPLILPTAFISYAIFILIIHFSRV